MNQTAAGMYQGFQQTYQQGTNQGYNTQQGYQNPYYVNAAGMNPNDFNGGSPKKKSKRRIIIPIVILLIVLIIIGVVLFFVFRKNESPKDVVTSAMNNTFSQKVPTSVSSYIGSDELNKLVESGAYEESFTLNITSLDGYSMPNEAYLLEGMGLSAVVSSDLNNEQFSGCVALTYGGISYLDFKIYAYDDYMAVSCPSLFDGYIEFKTSDFSRDFNNSPLSSMLGETIDTVVTFDFFEYMKEISSNTNVNTELPDEINEFMENIEYRKADALTIEINGKSQNCQGYDVVVTPEAMEAIASYIADQSSVSLSEIKEYLPSEELVFTVYVDNQDRMVQLSFNTSMKVDYYTMTIQGDLSFIGKDRPTDQISGVIDVTMAGSTLSITINSLTNNTDTTSVTNANIDMSMADMNIGSVTYSSSFDTQSGNYYLSLESEVMYETLIDLCLDTTYHDVVAGKGYTCDINELYINIGDEFEIGMDGSLSVAPLSGSVEQPSGTSYDLFQMTESDFEALAAEMTDNLLNSPFASIVGEIYDEYSFDDYDDYYYDDYYDDYDDYYDYDDFYDFDF